MMAMLFAEGSCGVSVRPLASALPISPTISDVAEVTQGEAMAAATIASRAALPRERVFVPKAVYARAPLPVSRGPNDSMMTMILGSHRPRRTW